MAEDTRNRVDDSPKGSRESSDPLAELARLIGQSDPFTDRAALRKPMGGMRNDDRPAPEWLARPAAREDEYEAPEDHYATPQERSAPPGGYRDEHYDAEHEPAHDAQYAEPDDAEQDHQAEHVQPHAPEAPRARYAAAAAEQAEQADQFESDDHYENDDRYRVAQPSGEYDGDGYYTDDGHLPPQSEQGVVGGRRRSGLITIAAVLGLAVIGTAGAFGYRAYTSGSASSGNPPVIKAADSGSLKTVPAPAAPSADAQGKPFQDRAATGTSERVVSREEQPVPLPAQRQPSPPPGQAIAPPAPGAGAPPAASVNEPKRVKTMVIRDPAAQTALAPSEQTIAPPAAAAPAQPAAPAARAPAAKQQPGPMAIAPASEPTTRKGQVATSYIVQLVSEPTEAEAQSAYRVLQQKYPALLGKREPTISRADLKGGVVRYRVRLTGFANLDAATSFCEGYKSAGGDCYVVNR